MSMTSPNDERGSLERLGITVSTGAPEDILTPNAVSAARFRKSKPWGYLADDVQNFVDITKSSVQWYRDKLHERDGVVHRLGKEIDDRESQIANLNLQLASASYNSNVSEAINRNAEDKEMAALMARQQSLEADLATAQREVADLREQLAVASAHMATAVPVAEDGDGEAAQLREELAAAQASNAALTADLNEARATLQAQQAVPAAEPDQDQIAALNAELEQLRQQNAQLDAYNQQMEKFADEQESYINTLLAQIPSEDDTLVEDAEGTPHDADAEDMTVNEVTYEVAASSETEEPEEQAYAADLATGHDDDEDDEDYDYSETDESDEDEDNVVEAEQKPGENNSGENETPVYMYNGVALPPGIRPEDL